MIDLLIRRREMGLPPKTPLERIVELGGVMWFPMDETNGLNDIIGGKVINELVSGSLTYNSTYGMYASKLGTTNQGVAGIDVSFAAQDFVDGKWTTVVQMRKYQTSSLTRLSHSVRTNHSGTGVVNNIIFFCLDENGSGDTSTWTDTIHTTTAVCGTGLRKIYHNDTLIIDDSVAYQHPWGCSKFYFRAYQPSQNGKYVYVKNFILFDRALTAEEVSEVYTILNNI